MNSDLENREYWRSLAQRVAVEAEQPAAAGAGEFASYDPQAMAGHSRREFLGVMAAALSLAGLTLSGCRRWPEQEIRPFAARPEGMSPGEATWYATLMQRDGIALGVLARCFDGRPIKIEGNPAHPDSLGAADAIAQASVLDLYDPDRSRAVLHRAPGQVQPAGASWEEFAAFLENDLASLRARGGAGLAVLAEPNSSPTVARLRRQLLRDLPKATWHTFAPLHRDQEIQGSIIAFGRPARSQLNLAAARIIACFDADLLGSHPARQRHAREWAAGRDTADQGVMNRLYVVESGLTLTGSVADVRLPLRPTLVALALAALARRLGLDVPELPIEEAAAQFVERLAADLLAHPGAALVAVGPAQPAAVHALAHAVNQRLAAVGKTVTFTQETEAGQDVAQLADLQSRIDAGQVHTLLILGGNPSYDARLRFAVKPGAPAAGNVAAAIHLGTHFNETSAACNWHLPCAHELECWGDGRGWDGTIGVQQPMILPLFGGRSALEVLAMLLGEKPDGQALVKQTIRTMIGGADFDAGWSQVLRSGVIAGSAWPKVSPGLPRLAALAVQTPAAADALEVLFIADASTHDGRYANNGWLQEMPDPVTQLVWDNAGLISSFDAQRLGLQIGDVVELVCGESRLQIPVMIQPGVARGAVILPLGYGRQIVGRVGRNVGHNVYPLRPADHAFVAAVTALNKTGRHHQLVTTQEHHLLDAVGAAARDKRIGAPNESGLILQEATLSAYHADDALFQKHGHGLALKLYDPPDQFNQPHAWGMAIDLNKCIGCNACLVACQAENNVPIVGKQEVARHREMHWLRVDRYYKGDVDNPQVVHQPLACAQCESAPCEQVCPVAATVHDSEGLNAMVYNRCIGTRYCSNNCPYKVRRFNYFDWHSRDARTEGDTPPWLGIPDRQQELSVDKIKAMAFNPDVTVRMRGVMEKCTYCTQRIQAGRIHAKLEHAAGRRAEQTVLDGEVTPACGGSCPTQAIVFGDLNDPNSRVAKLHAHRRAYGMLDELLNLKPRTRYLAKLRNPQDVGQKEDGA